MNFCTNCGMQSKGTSKFCMQCGTVLPVDKKKTAQTASPAKTSSAATPQKGKTQAIVTVISALTIFAMLMGWLTMQIDLTRDATAILVDEGVPREIVNMLQSDLSYTMTVHELSNHLGWIDWTLSAFDTAMRGELAAYELAVFRVVAAPVRLAATAVNMVRILIILICLLFVGFLYGLLAGSRFAGIIGQVAACLALLAALVFIISMAVLNSQFADLARDAADDTMFAYIGIGFRASMWTWLTFALGAAGFILITLRKKVINGMG